VLEPMDWDGIDPGLLRELEENRAAVRREEDKGTKGQGIMEMPKTGEKRYGH
jgi:hypothetical protein